MSRVTFPVGIAELLLLDLAVWITGELSQEVDAFRALVVGESFPAELDQFGLCDVASTFDKGLNLLAELSVRNTNNGNVGDCRVAEEDIFDLGWIDVGAPRDDHVGLAVCQVEIALFVDVPHISDRKHLSSPRLGGFVGSTLVFEAQSVVYVDLPDLSGSQLIALVIQDVDLYSGDGSPDRSRSGPPDFLGALGRVALGGCVVLIHTPGRKHIEGFPFHVDWAGSSGVQNPLYR